MQESNRGGTSWVLTRNLFTSRMKISELWKPISLTRIISLVSIRTNCCKLHKLVPDHQRLRTDDLTLNKAVLLEKK